MSIEWKFLRTVNGSQQLAFEELCCQLAEYENVPAGSSFTRKGSPDAGIECYWCLQSGEEWAWQAKYFLSPPDKSQWKDVDRSVQTALDKHPRLSRYTICFPIDPPDPRLEDQLSMMDQWRIHVNKWIKWANDRRMAVQFLRWGNHEFLERLAREEHRGRFHFFFNKDLFSKHWFSNRVQESIANAGTRYTPEININLPIARAFGSLGRTPEFFSTLRKYSGQIKKQTSYVQPGKNEPATPGSGLLQEQIDQSISYLDSINPNDQRPINWDRIKNITEKAAESASNYLENSIISKSKVDNLGNQTQDWLAYHLNKLSEALHDLYIFADSSEAQLANIASLLIVGEAGTGKTHLFCDIVKQRDEQGYPSILLFGENFTDAEPWNQISALLGISETRDEFLGALNAAAQLLGYKAIIFIDALNEGVGKVIWKRNLAGILAAISRYPWIAIAISVRSSYEDIIIPENLVPTKLIKLVHQGFVEEEYRATQTFFQYYGLEHPRIPLFVPEFQNPLFLKLFCQGLKNRGITRLPPGKTGMAAIFDNFIESVNQKLSKADCLDFDAKSRVVQKALYKMAELMTERSTKWLLREEAQTICNRVLPGRPYHTSLFRHLILEGVIRETRTRMEKRVFHECIQFAYDRFTDHMLACFLLDHYLDEIDPRASFQKENQLGKLFQTERDCWNNRGILEAFTIQIPERTGKELIEFLPEIREYRPVQITFLKSLSWRDPSCFFVPTLSYINELIIKDQEYTDAFRDFLLSVCADPSHPYNADFLHNLLYELPLPERDSTWTIYLHEQYDSHSLVDRLLEWILSFDDTNHIDDEALRLLGITFAWFFVSSNRFLRDRSTKGLVKLFTNRLSIMQKVLSQMYGVNDPYVLERLFAVAYGSTMRSTSQRDLIALATTVYDLVFRDGNPPVHILTRDYARSVIEFAISKGASIQLQIEKILPPYHSEWPSNILSSEDLVEYGKWDGKKPDKQWAILQLYASIMEDDFARYVIGTNTGSFDWSSRPIEKKEPLTRKEIYEDWLESLTKNQREYWDQFLALREKIPWIFDLNDPTRTDRLSLQITNEELNNQIRDFQSTFRKVLGRKKSLLLDQVIIPYLDEPGFEDYPFDLSLIQRFIFQRVLDLGWSVNRFGWFDQEVWRIYGTNRDDHKPERIGKKYQWIAYHEILARIADNFEFVGQITSDTPDSYQGPWQIHIRDIDPSCVISETKAESDWGNHLNTWWFPEKYNAWEMEANNQEWLGTSHNLPDPKNLLGVVNPSDRTNWLVLDAFYRWRKNIPGADEDGYPNRDIWYQIQSFIIKKEDSEVIYRWAKDQNFVGNWMPHAEALGDLFIGEYYWSPAYQYYTSPRYGYEEWTTLEDGRNPIPKPVLLSTQRYVQSSEGYDCSLENTVDFYVPTNLLIKGMGLNWNGKEACFFDKAENLIAFDPSIFNQGPSALLMKRDALMLYLKNSGYDIFWTIAGEKKVIDNAIRHQEWIGRLDISGAYMINKNRIEGSLTTYFVR